MPCVKGVDKAQSSDILGHLLLDVVGNFSHIQS